MRPSRLLGHHLMQTPDDGPPRRCPQRHPQPEGVDRHRVGGGGGIKIMHNTLGQWREGVVRGAGSRRHATVAGPIQRLQSGFQRRQRIRL